MYISDCYNVFLSCPVDRCDHVSFNASSGAAYSGFKGFWVLAIAEFTTCLVSYLVSSFVLFKLMVISHEWSGSVIDQVSLPPCVLRISRQLPKHTSSTFCPPATLATPRHNKLELAML
ncbi:hypothetical protein N7516_005181 [Penicillium verrucosum]|uniref:uncharacterized protein n=1 Tax=Penicillium verrucosum TaxID=60171 RepID=UPI002544E77E|nr:uncharacterized protein N7516_005181 [Penicillium verrucosum]KAJ5945013.1 hypothetical protein N7516_005181 [Penicillium verrucosum]